MGNLEDIHLLDFQKICRICLSKANIRPIKNYFTSVFKLVTGNEFFSDAEYLPKNVCDDCCLKLEEISNFIEMYKHNDSKLKLIFMNEYDRGNTNEIVQYFDKTNKELENEHKGFIMANSSKTNINLDPQSKLNMENIQDVKKTEKEIIDLCQENVLDTNNENNIEIVCNTCSRTFGDVKDLFNHERFNPKCNQGNNINKVFNFNKRRLVKPTSDPKRIKKKLNQNNLKKLKMMSLKTDCEVCTRVFLSEEELLNHQRFNPDCKKELVNKEVENVQKNIQQNQLIIEDTVQKSMMCSSLPLKELVKNMKNSYTCDQCKKSFKNKWCYERHIKTHTGERPHTCNICKRGFRQKAHLKDHLRIHTGEKPYQCFICKRSFRHLSTISKHQHTHIEVS